MTTTVISTATPPLAMPDQIAGMRYGLQVNGKVRPGQAAACRSESSGCGGGFQTSQMWGPGLKHPCGKSEYEEEREDERQKDRKKILPFPAPREPEIRWRTY